MAIELDPNHPDIPKYSDNKTKLKSRKPATASPDKGQYNEQDKGLDALEYFQMFLCDLPLPFCLELAIHLLMLCYVVYCIGDCIIINSTVSFKDETSYIPTDPQHRRRQFRPRRSRRKLPRQQTLRDKSTPNP